MGQPPCNKQLLNEVEHASRIFKDEGCVIDNTNRGLDNCRYHAKTEFNNCFIMYLIIYKEMFLGCDWLIRVQLIQNITQNSAKSVTTVQKSVTTVQKSVTTVQKSVTTAQKSVISSLSDGIYSQKNQKYGGRIFTFA